MDVCVFLFLLLLSVNFVHPGSKCIDSILNLKILSLGEYINVNKNIMKELGLGGELWVPNNNKSVQKDKVLQ